MCPFAKLAILLKHTGKFCLVAVFVGTLCSRRQCVSNATSTMQHSLIVAQAIIDTS